MATPLSEETPKESEKKMCTWRWKEPPHPPSFVDSAVSEPEYRLVALSAMIIGLLVQFGPSYA